MQITLRAPARLPPPSARPPLLGVVPEEVAALHDELRAYPAAFASHFRRAEQRHWALKYTEGQLLPLERKSIEPLADALEGGNVQAMQRFIGLGAWDDDAVLATHQQLVAETLGDVDTGVLIVDGCDCPKQGRHAVGVARQYCGPLGEVANCQASVVACYASARGYTLVDRRLYLPEDWFGATERGRWGRCGIPDGTAFQTRTALAWGMIAALHARGALPFRWVTGDEHCGNTPVLLDRIAAAGLAYCMEVPHNVRGWPVRPLTAVPAATGRKGAPFTRVRLAPTRPRRCGWLRWRRRCRRARGTWRRSRRAVRGRSSPRWRSSAPSPCATACPARTSGSSSGGRWMRHANCRCTCVTPPPTRPARRWSGCWACAGPSSRPLRKGKRSWASTTTRYAAGSAGTTTPP